MVERILIVEDDGGHSGIIKKNMIKSGCTAEVERASDGVEAVQKAIEFKPDLITMDIRLHPMDGLEATREILGTPGLEDTIIVFLTATDNPSEVDEALQLGATGFLTKPVDYETFADTIKELFTIVKDEPDNSILRHKIIAYTMNSMPWLKYRLSLSGQPERLLSRQPSHPDNSAPDLSEFGKMTGTLLHDLKNNNLMIVDCGKELIEEIQTGGNREIMLELANEIVKRSRIMFQDMSKIRNLTMAPSLSMRPLDINAVLGESLELLALKGVTLDKDLSPVLPPIKGDQDQLMQLFSNLFQNALQAMPGGGTLRVTTGISEGNSVRIEIADTGCGISEENLGRIFDLNFTTKREGYGLGLYLVRNIATLHGGKILLTSKVNQGTTFIILLPVKKEENFGP